MPIQDNIYNEKSNQKNEDAYLANAPPKRSIKNNRLFIREVKSQTIVPYIKNLLKEKTNFQKDKEEKKSIELDIVNNFKGNINKDELNKIRTILNYNDSELNSMKYKKALKYDHRGFLRYYYSLLKSKHLLLTLIETNDYNSRIIKIYLIFFNFSSCYAINALFYDDATMHQIYEDKGKYNFFAQLPQIIYSTIISYFFDVLFGFLAFPDDDIIGVKKEMKIKFLSKKKDLVMKTLHIKFIIFFIISFLFLDFFWYYTTCFCAVYKNTQYHLLKDSLISFSISMGTPFALCLLPPVFRIPGLKSKSKSHQIMYRLSKFIQFF